MTMRFREGYKKHLQRIIKERNLKKRIKHDVSSMKKDRKNRQNLL